MVGSHVSSCDPVVGSHDLLCPTPPGDYDALLVLMLLPRLTFKADLVIDQLKQQVRNLHSCYVRVTTRVVVCSRAQTLDINHLYFAILFKALISPIGQYVRNVYMCSICAVTLTTP